MKLKTAFLAFGLAAFAAIATETNLVTAVPWFREVDGQLYNTERSIKFQPFSGQVAHVLTNAIIIQQITQQPVYGAAKPDSLVSGGNFLGSSGVPPARPIIKWETVYGEKIFITNFPSDLQPTTGSKQSGKAMKIGTINFDGDVLQLWNYGTPHRVMVVTTNKTSKISN